MLPKHVDTSLLRRVNAEVRRTRARSRTRPTVVAVVRTRIGDEFRFLIIDSINGIRRRKKNPGLPKGGVNAREDVEQALRRELQEELGIIYSCTRVVAYLGVRNVLSQRKGRRRFKRYFAFLVEYVGPNTLTTSSAEVRGYKWVRDSEFARILAPIRSERPDKYETCMHFLTLAALESVVAASTEKQAGHPTCL